jgi:ParB-like chromosome segregation protein Spo0J
MNVCRDNRDDDPTLLLRQAEWNANVVPRATLEKVRRSIEEFGFVENLVARPHPDEVGALEVLSGNHRLEILIEMMVEEAPVVVLELGDGDARILAQALNRTRGRTDDPDAYAGMLETVLAEVGIKRALEFLPETESSIEKALGAVKPATVHESTRVSVSELRRHPRNYRQHPKEQLDHLIKSIKEHGFYRNVVVANDGTILAGHGVVEAAEILGMTEVPVIQLSVGPEDPKALKILTGDNELSRVAGIDDRLLADILRDVKEGAVDGLEGTGYDEKMLANLVFMTRTEFEAFDAAAPGWDAGIQLGQQTTPDFAQF